MRAGHEVSASVVDFEHEIERTYVQLNVCIFWADQFVQIAPLEQAEEMLIQLVRIGKLRCRAELRCVEGHTIWEHDLDRLEEGRACTCTECAEPDAGPADAYLRFEIADAWLAVLKKKAQTRRARR